MSGRLYAGINYFCDEYYFLEKLLFSPYCSSVSLVNVDKRNGKTIHGRFLVRFSQRTAAILQRNIYGYSICEGEGFELFMWITKMICIRLIIYFVSIILFFVIQVFRASMQVATPFEFRIRYKFISQSDAIVRWVHTVSQDCISPSIW